MRNGLLKISSTVSYFVGVTSSIFVAQIISFRSSLNKDWIISISSEKSSVAASAR
jgi:hypothetical protein